MRETVLMVAIALAAAGVVHAGVVIKNSEKDLPGGKETGSETIYVQSGKVRIDSLDSRGRVTDFTLFRDGVVWQVDVASRTYRKLDKAAMQKAAAQQQQAIAKAKAQMANMTPEQRQRMSKVLGDMQAGGSSSTAPHAEPVFSRTGRTETIGSLTCQVWESKVGGKTSAQYCVATPGSIPGGGEALAGLKQMMTTLKEITADLPMAGKELGVLADGIRKLDGYPVVVREFTGNKPDSERTYKTSNSEALAADKFEIPKGFKEKVAFEDDED